MSGGFTADLKTGQWHGRSAFTLLELLVIIIIFALVVAIAVPSFSALLYSSSQSRAANQVEVAVAAARDAAMASPAGHDAAAVFLYEPGGRTSIVACVEVGVLRDVDPQNPGDPDLFVKREVFVPVAGMQPFELPLGWMVRGYAPPGSLHQAIDGRRTGWYDLGANTTGYSEIQHYTLDEANWLFPESGFYQIDTPDSGKARQTFMIRFEGTTGRQDVTHTAPVLILWPSPSVKLRQQNPAWPGAQDYRADRATSLERFCLQVLGAPPGGGGLSFGAGQTQVVALDLADKQAILGDRSVDTILARPLAQIAVYNAQRMAGAIGARAVNRDTGCLYLPMEPTDEYARLDTSLFAGISPKAISRRALEWIEGRYSGGPSINPNSEPVPSDARIFGVRRIDGTLIELTQTEGQT